MRVLIAIAVLIITGCYTSPSYESQVMYQQHLDSGLESVEKERYWEAVESFSEALAQKETAVALSNRGLAYQHLGQFDKSLVDHNRAIVLDANDAGSYVNRAALLATRDLGVPHALDDLDKALELDGANAHAWGFRGALKLKLGDIKGAHDDLSQAFKLGHADAGDLNSLAWILATSPDDSIRDGQEAVKIAQLAFLGSESEDPWQYIDTLAAAHAANGAFDKAVEKQEEAIESATEDQRAAMQERLKLYQSGKAYRVP